MPTKKTVKKETTNTAVKLEALSNLTGKYLLPYSVGQVFTIDKNRAEELIENEDAKIVK
jgi:hypothetical protein